MSGNGGSYEYSQRSVDGRKINELGYDKLTLTQLLFLDFMYEGVETEFFNNQEYFYRHSELKHREELS